MIDKKILKALRVEPCRKIRLKDYDTRWPDGEPKGNLDPYKSRSEAILQDNRQKLAEAQELLYADDRYSLLLVFQALDAAGKDGAIKHVMSGINPQDARFSLSSSPRRRNWTTTSCGAICAVYPNGAASAFLTDPIMRMRWW